MRRGLGRRRGARRPRTRLGPAPGARPAAGQLEARARRPGELGDVPGGDEQLEVAEDLEDDEQRLLRDGRRSPQALGDLVGGPRALGQEGGMRSQRRSCSARRRRRAGRGRSRERHGRQQAVERHRRRAPQALEVAQPRAGAAVVGTVGRPRSRCWTRCARRWSPLKASRSGRRRTACRSCCAPAGRRCAAPAAGVHVVAVGQPAVDGNASAVRRMKSQNGSSPRSVSGTP